MTTDERIERLTGIVESLASSVVAHDDQIESLLKIAEKQQEQSARTDAAVASLAREWQAYITRLPKN